LGEAEGVVMKRLIFTLIAMAWLTPVYGADPGPKNGFRDLQWGDKPTNEFIKMNTGFRNMKVYYKQNDNKKVAGFDCSQIVYEFYNKRFCRVELHFPSMGKEDIGSLVLNLQKEWGTPDEINNNENLYTNEWDSENDITRSFLYTIRDLKLKDSWLIQLNIENKKCLSDANNDVGL
jgi:hypothetical protein